jgi:hypothetical protein
LTVTAATGSSFNATSSTVYFGATAATILARSTSQISVISPIAYTGQVTVRNVVVGSATVDSLKTNASYTIAKAAFPGTITTNGTLLDTVRVFATATAKFSLVSTALSNVTIGGLTAFVISRTADSMLVVAKRGSTGAVTISNVVVGAARIPSLPSSGNVVISTATTGELNEPGNDVRATATTVAFTGATDTITVYGSLDCEDDGTDCPGNGDIIDYFQIAFAGGQNLRGILSFMGTGNPGADYNDTNNPDLDLCIRISSATYFGTCTSTNGAGLIQPEIATTTTVGGVAANTYYFRVMAWVTASPIAYQLKIVRTP